MMEWLASQAPTINAVANVLTLLTALAIGITMRRALSSTHDLVNGQTEHLVRIERALGHAEGLREGIAQERSNPQQDRPAKPPE